MRNVPAAFGASPSEPLATAPRSSAITLDIERTDRADVSWCIWEG
jgi:hypothetical protein